jgi:hypothetical protein
MKADNSPFKGEKYLGLQFFKGRFKKSIVLSIRKPQRAKLLCQKVQDPSEISEEN